jgi:hypothetical protein
MAPDLQSIKMMMMPVILQNLLQKSNVFFSKKQKITSNKKQIKRRNERKTSKGKFYKKNTKLRNKSKNEQKISVCKKITIKNSQFF